MEGNILVVQRLGLRMLILQGLQFGAKFKVGLPFPHVRIRNTKNNCQKIFY